MDKELQMFVAAIAVVVLVYMLFNSKSPEGVNAKSPERAKNQERVDSKNPEKKVVNSQNPDGDDGTTENDTIIKPVCTYYSAVGSVWIPSIKVFATACLTSADVVLIPLHVILDKKRLSEEKQLVVLDFSAHPLFFFFSNESGKVSVLKVNDNQLLSENGLEILRDHGDKAICFDFAFISLRKEVDIKPFLLPSAEVWESCITDPCQTLCISFPYIDSSDLLLKQTVTVSRNDSFYLNNYSFVSQGQHTTQKGFSGSAIVDSKNTSSLYAIHAYCDTKSGFVQTGVKITEILNAIKTKPHKGAAKELTSEQQQKLLDMINEREAFYRVRITSIGGVKIENSISEKVAAELILDFIDVISDNSKELEDLAKTTWGVKALKRHKAHKNVGICLPHFHHPSHINSGDDFSCHLFYAPAKDILLWKKAQK